MKRRNRSIGKQSTLNSYDLPTTKATSTPAPVAQLAQLDYQHLTAVTALASANPSAQDTKHITLDRTDYHATREGWEQSVERPGVPNSFRIPATIKIDQPADAQTSDQLNQIATNRQFKNDHYAEKVSQAYVMDYTGKGWEKNGPLPDAVTHALKLPSEEHIKDPATGQTWTAIGKGAFEHSRTTMAYTAPITETVKPNADELARLNTAQQTAAETNAAYDSNMIAQAYARQHPAQQPAVEPSSPSHGVSPQVPSTAPPAHAAAERAAQAVHPEDERAQIAPAAVSAAARQVRQSIHEASQRPTSAPPAHASPAPASVHAAAPYAVAAAPPAPVLSPPLDPPAMRDFRHAEHPLHARYQMFRDALGEQEFYDARYPLKQVPEVRAYSAEQKDRLAAGFIAQLGADTRYSKEIQRFGKEGEALLAVEHPQRLGDKPLVLTIDRTQTLARTPEAHAAAWRARELPAQQDVNTARPDPQTLSPDHPGHPDHPRHAMFEHARDALTTEYARWGMQKGAESLDRETMQVMIAAREQRMNDVGAIRLVKGTPDGRIGEYPLLALYDTPKGPDKFLADIGIVESQTLQQAPPVAQPRRSFRQWISRRRCRCSKCSRRRSARRQRKGQCRAARAWESERCFFADGRPGGAKRSRSSGPVMGGTNPGGPGFG